jgi:TonB family protein
MRGLARLYPKRWRTRYGDELDALLAQARPGFWASTDLLRGALDAHVRECVRRLKEARPRRFTAIAISAALHLGAVGGAVAWRMTRADELPAPKSLLIVHLARTPPLGAGAGVSKAPARARKTVAKIPSALTPPTTIPTTTAPATTTTATTTTTTSSTTDGDGEAGGGGVGPGDGVGAGGGGGGGDGMGSEPAPRPVAPDVADAYKLSGSLPSYTPAAKAARQTGTVLAKVCVGTMGAVSSVTVLRGLPLLDDEVRRTVERWRYRPFLYNGRAVPFCHVASFVFELR